MINDFEVGFKILVLNLLEEDFQFVFYLFYLVEKVELLPFTCLDILIDELIDKFLELLRPWVNWHRVNSEWLVFIVFELNPNVLGQLDR